MLLSKMFLFFPLAAALVSDLAQLEYDSYGKLASNYLLSTEAW